MTPTAAIILTLIAILFSGLFSGTEIAFMQSDRVRTEIDAARGGLVNRIIQHFSRSADMFISTLLVGNNVVLVIYGIAFSAIVNPLFSQWFHSEALVLTANTILSTLIILFAGEFLPKSTFRVNPNLMLRVLALPLYVIYLVLYPVSLLVSWISRALMRLFGVASDAPAASLLTIEQIDDYLETSLQATAGSDAVENEVKIFHNALEFKDTQIGDCMIPRNEIVAVSLEGTTRDELIRRFIATGLSKIVVYREDIDDVAGYIHVSELFEPDADWTKLLKPVIFTPETMLANKMMRRMMAEKRSMAIIIDEFGSTAGLATLEDLVEEIFGEIEDEHDRNKAIGRRLPGGTVECSGRAEIERINDEFELHIPESEEYHTLAGYILEKLEALPAPGDSFAIDGFRFEIVRMSATRIELVRITPADPEN